jgi:hypothetical protein
MQITVISSEALTGYGSIGSAQPGSSNTGTSGAAGAVDAQAPALETETPAANPLSGSDESSESLPSHLTPPADPTGRG